MKKIHISQVDALFANGRYPIEFLFYYRYPIPVKNLRGALRDLAKVFWPAFGEYGDGFISFDRYREEDCFDEEVVDGDLDVSDIQAAGPEVISRFGLKGLRRLFFLKAFRFRNGTVLIPKLMHVAGDGYSYFTLLSVLAAIARPSRVPFKSSFVRSMFKPHHRRTGLKDFSFQGEWLEPDIPNERLTSRSEEIPCREVQSLVREAASSHDLRISSNDILSAMIVKRLVRIQRERWPGSISLTIPIDVRGKVKEYGRRFFGNGIMLHKLDLDREGIENSPSLEIAAQIRRSMPFVSGENYVPYLEGLENIIADRRWDQFKPFDPKSGCLVTNLSRLPAERLDFGTGFPLAIVPLTLEENSAGILSGKENYVLRYAY